MSIPKFLHQIWLGNQKERPTQLMATWSKRHLFENGWEYVLWTDERVDVLFKNSGTPLFNQEIYDSLDSYVAKADILRYEILYRYGGIYADADSDCHTTIPDSLLENTCFACWENEYARTGLVNNAFLGAIPHHQLFRQVMDKLKADTPYFAPVDGRIAWITTGPVMFTNCIAKSGLTDINIQPSWLFEPNHHTGSNFSGSNRVSSLANHFFASSKVYRPAIAAG